MGQRITTMTSGQARLPVAPSMFPFQKYENNESGLWVSDLYPHTGSVANELCVIKTMHTEAINHDPGITFFQTGHQQPGRPSMGAWISYGLGSENHNLPSFVVLISQGFGNMQALYSRLWGSGFLPSEHQGVQFRAGADPVLFLSNPKGVHRDDRRQMLDAIAALNERELDRSGDPEIQTRIAQYEMAYRMQMSVPDLTDFSDEPEETFELYGPDLQDARHLRLQLPHGPPTSPSAACGSSSSTTEAGTPTATSPARSASSARRPTSPRQASSRTSSAVACSRRPSSSGAASSGAPSIARAP